MKKTLLTLGVCAMMVFVAAVSAQANVVYDLTSDHCTGGCGPAGTIFGTVTLNQSGTTVDVTVHLNSPYEFAKTGAVDDQAFKFNGTGVVVGDISVDQTVPGQTLAADSGTFNGDGTGTFGLGIICTTCGGGLSSAFTNDIVFHVASATIADLTDPTLSGTGQVFVADIGNSVTGVTGPIDASTPVPEPATLLLLGVGLTGLGFVRRWKS